jgi:branched-chain amino acid transport system permease protein
VRKTAAAAVSAFLGALIVLGVLAVGATGAFAAGETVRGNLTNAGKPVAGVQISVTQGETDVGKATTDDKGHWEVPVPGEGQYSVTLDQTTLPEGVDLRFPERKTLTVMVNGGQQRAVLFALGKSTAVKESTTDRALQLAAEGLRFGLIMALASVGLSLIYGTTGLVNFAHGELVTLGALVAYFMNVIAGIPLIGAAVISVVICAIAGYLLDRGLWGWLRHRGTGLIAMMIVSIGLALFVRYLFLFIFGGNTRAFRDYQGQKGMDLGPVSFSPVDLVSMAIAIVVLLGVSYVLLRTKVGKATRAVADNPALASASGIDVERIIRLVWAGGTAIAGLSGVLLGLDQQVNFQMGFQILLLVFAAVTLGGLGTAFGALVGSLVVGMFIQLITLVIPAELKNVGALGILIVILLVRPQGILGRAERVG